MARKKLQWQLFPSYLFITVFSLLAVSVFSSRYIKDFYLDKTYQDLHSRAVLVGESVGKRILNGEQDGIDEICVRLGKESSTRITVILMGGVVAGDTDEYPENMDNHLKRPEIILAGKNGVGKSIRFSNTLKERMMYVAIPLKSADGDTIGFVRTSITVTSIDKAIRNIKKRIGLLGLIVAIFAAVISLYVSRRISRPIEEIKSMAERYAIGDFSERIPAPDTEEISGLADSMNMMAVQLDDRIKTVVRQKNELEAVLTSMVEGVVAIDTNENVISINRAASQMFSIEGRDVCGRSIQETVRNTDLHDFISRSMKNNNPLEEEIGLRGGEEELFIQVHGSKLADGTGENIGVLIVLNDITKLKKLENMRRDFVANVSHELKTPITSIKGFVETILDGAIENREETTEFLGIIEKQSDRLNTIIDDLLKLSKIEKDTENEEIELSRSTICDVLRSAIDSCGMVSKEKNVQIELQCNSDLEAQVNAHLLEQSVLNLLDNAVKYSPEKTTVHVEAKIDSGRLLISVKDEGPGIPHEHRDRLFERFYRVDKARSRNLGGTGLGLSIVKHVASAHGGTASLESTSGKGSTFVIDIPA